MYGFSGNCKAVAMGSNNLLKRGCRCRQQDFLLIFKYSTLPEYAKALTPIRPHLRDKSVNINYSSYLCQNKFKMVIDGSDRPGHISLCVSWFHTSRNLSDSEPRKPSSKVEETVEVLKETLKKKSDVIAAEKVVAKKSIGQRVMDEIKHYYHGFRLLFIDIGVSWTLGWRILNGKSLSRREHRQLVRTVSDLFRLVPFSVFIIVPFMELLLPVALKLFPGMLPSTFQTANEKEDKMKKALKVKLEMAKFLQETLDDMAVTTKGHFSQSAKDFAEFFTKVRTSGEQATNKEILRFSKLFEDEITLDSLSRPQLAALCRVLEIQPLGTNNFLRFQLRLRLRQLAADDKLIMKEGIESLTASELQQTCRSRGMRAYGVSEERLRSQLEQWLDLSLNEKVPPSLLLLSRALLLPDTITPGDQLKATISVLPDTVVTKASAAISEREGKIDNLLKLELIKEEQRKIKEERQEEREERKRQEDTKKKLQAEVSEVLMTDEKAVSEEKPSAEPVAVHDKSVPEIYENDMEVIESGLASLTKEKKRLVETEELKELKEEMEEYREDVENLAKVSKAVDSKGTVKESLAAKRLSKKVNTMISKMDQLVNELQKEEEQIKQDLDKHESVEKKQELVSIEEFIDTIRRIQKVPDTSRLERIAQVLAGIDVDRDGSVRVEDVRKVLEVIGQENVHLNPKQVSEIVQLLDREELLEIEDQIGKVLEQETITRSVRKNDGAGDSPTKSGDGKKSPPNL
ncbi:mitochondrial proton/calcium exchanger protein [Ischnura elegans]|uniref:mitochondrial proton/calcium exchanger protein n=1 Tax=Ischnura elegans TaxID=197161 RepID=UPI001ED88105|nr:mitochondrial proton/calcium exchanger protein [Ischnura elegans]